MDGQWKVQLEDGTEETFCTEPLLVRAITDGRIRRDAKGQQVRDSKGNEISSPEWVDFFDKVIKPAFYLRVLFEPVKAHTLRGASVGARVGVVAFLFLCITQCLSNSLWGVAFWLAVVLVLWATPFIKHLLGSEAAGMTIGSLFVLPLVQLIRTGEKGKQLVGSLHLSASFSPAMYMQLGATIAGAVVGVFPGMMIGTAIGFVRRKKLRLSPRAELDKGALANGLLLPAVLFAVVLVVYALFFNWAREWLETQHPQGLR